MAERSDEGEGDIPFTADRSVLKSAAVVRRSLAQVLLKLAHALVSEVVHAVSGVGTGEVRGDGGRGR